MKKILLIFAIATLFSGCATTASVSYDPAEPLNRKIFAFNEAVDGAIIKPVASGYDKSLPEPAKIGVRNFFSNLDDLPGTLLHAISGEPLFAVEAFARALFNSSFGIFGLFDVASDMGIPKTRTSFGTVAAKWGVPFGPYVVLPLFGPSTLRDAAALPIDMAIDPLSYVSPVSAKNVAQASRVIDKRAVFLPFDKLVDEAAIDRYSFIRDASIQRRRHELGLPPLRDEE